MKAWKARQGAWRNLRSVSLPAPVSATLSFPRSYLLGLGAVKRVPKRRRAGTLQHSCAEKAHHYKVSTWSHEACCPPFVAAAIRRMAGSEWSAGASRFSTYAEMAASYEGSIVARSHSG